MTSALAAGLRGPRLHGVSIAIRSATDADWPRIWPVVEAVVREGETYTYPTDLTSEQARDLWMERPPGRTIVAEDGGELLGTAKMGPNKPGHGDHVGTASFMVAAAGRGRGVGRALGEHVIAWHREQGFRGIRRPAVAVARLRGRRHRARRLPVAGPRVRRPARDVPAARALTSSSRWQAIPRA
jgi:GNAT superfamily N-acetyltransferase